DDGRRKLLAGNQRQRKVVSALQPGARGAREERPGHGEVRSSKFHEWREEPCANEASASAHGTDSDRRKRLRQSDQRAEAGQPAESLRSVSLVSGVSGQRRCSEGKGVCAEGRELQFPAGNSICIREDESRESVSKINRRLARINADKNSPQRHKAHEEDDKELECPCLVSLWLISAFICAHPRLALSTSLHQPHVSVAKGSSPHKLTDHRAR